MSTFNTYKLKSLINWLRVHAIVSLLAFIYGQFTCQYCEAFSYEDIINCSQQLGTQLFLYALIFLILYQVPALKKIGLHSPILLLFLIVNLIFLHTISNDNFIEASYLFTSLLPNTLWYVSYFDSSGIELIHEYIYIPYTSIGYLYIVVFPISYYTLITFLANYITKKSSPTA